MTRFLNKVGGYNGGGAGFDPSDIPGLKVWCKADGQMTRDGGNNVSAWGETSGSLVQLTQVVAAKEPEYVADFGDGKPAVVFDGLDDAMSVPLSLSTSNTVFVVTAFSGSGGDGYLFRHGNPGNQTMAWDDESVNGGPPGISHYNERGSIGSWKSVGVDLTQRRWRFEARAAHSDHEIWKDGIDQNAPTVGGFNNDLSESIISVTFFLASYNGVTLLFGGPIREFLVYDPPPSAVDAAQIDAYLERW